jgi:hypothetical protein
MLLALFQGHTLVIDHNPSAVTLDNGTLLGEI